MALLIDDLKAQLSITSSDDDQLLARKNFSVFAMASS